VLQPHFHPHSSPSVRIGQVPETGEELARIFVGLNKSHPGPTQTGRWGRRFSPPRGGSGDPSEVATGSGDPCGGTRDVLGLPFASSRLSGEIVRAHAGIIVNINEHEAVLRNQRSIARHSIIVKRDAVHRTGNTAVVGANNFGRCDINVPGRGPKREVGGGVSGPCEKIRDRSEVATGIGGPTVTRYLSSVGYVSRTEFASTGSLRLDGRQPLCCC
jgi:hypothetical protein